MTTNTAYPPELVKIQQDKPYHHQVPPYGDLGPPYVVSKHAIVYPDQKPKRRWSLMRFNYIDEQLSKCFPIVYVVTHAVCLILHSLVQIGLQIALMVTNGALYFVGAGIWGGIYFLVTAGVSLYLVLNRSHWVLIASYLTHIFGILVAVGAYLVVNIIGISEYTSICSYYPNCFNIDVKPISYIMFFMGVICIIMLLVYLVLMPCYIMDCCNRKIKYKQQISEPVRNSSDFLMHSSLFAQHDLNKDGTVKLKKVNTAPATFYDYPVQKI